MVHFLRNKSNRTIVECEVSGGDLHCSADILEYSTEFLQNYTKSNHEGSEFAISIYNLCEIRGAWWEGENESGNWASIDKFVMARFIEAAERWGLYYVTD